MPTNNNTGSLTNTLIAGITTTEWNSYRIVWEPSTYAKFYVNGSLVATSTTTLPASSNQHFGVGGTVNGEDVVLSNVIISQEL